MSWETEEKHKGEGLENRPVKLGDKERNREDRWGPKEQREGETECEGRKMCTGAGRLVSAGQGTS